MLTMSDEITTSDATISAPKSVSLAALIGGDGRIRDAYRESVNDALKEFEKYLQARGGGPPSRHHKP
jgi:conjugative relaxase-like TrwC/TraI family protein